MAMPTPVGAARPTLGQRTFAGAMFWCAQNDCTVGFLESDAVDYDYCSASCSVAARDAAGEPAQAASAASAPDAQLGPYLSGSLERRMLVLVS